MSRFSVLICAVFLLLRSYGSSSKPVTSVDVHRTKILLRQQPSPHRYLDVRTEEEFMEGHPENSVNIPYMFDTPQGRVKNPKFVDQVLAVFGKDDHLVVGCRSGVRSVYATADLQNDADFKNVVNMEGGYLEWINNGFPVQEQLPAPHSEL